MDGDDVLKVFDAEIESHHAVFVVGAVDPNQTVFGFHFDSDIGEPAIVFTKFLGTSAMVRTKWILLMCIVRPRLRRAWTASCTVATRRVGWPGARQRVQAHCNPGFLTVLHGASQTRKLPEIVGRLPLS
ncbi:hypothetical protein NKJ71_32740, partial [Mesorhizobium sp. M0050]|uniref:hypothetical protein n=1 Tax=Mesorhizobium sp. M0050 TaxID=2956861 RepID=UPI003338D4B0